jgi:hypothetical protein
MNTRITRFCLPLAAAVALIAGAPSAQDAPAAASAAGAAREELLQLAFSAYDGMPRNPHEKNKSRGQHAAVEACIDLGLLEMATSLGDALPDWRRGLAAAQCALALQRAGRADGVAELLARAEQEARQILADPGSQSWRGERILAVVAETRLLRGEMTEFEKASVGITPAEAAPLQRAGALNMPVESFATWLQQADKVFASQQFEEVLSTLRACGALFERFFDDAEKRDALQDRIMNAYEKLPRQMRIELLLDCAAFAAGRGDVGRAQQLAAQAEKVYGVGQWRLEDQTVLPCKIAAVVFRAGDAGRAREMVAAAAAAFESNRERIFDIYRAEPLRQLAAANFALGDAGAGMEFLRRAVEAGVENPNSRPRADDLAGTALLMARKGWLPDAPLWERMRQIASGLGEPW